MEGGNSLCLMLLIKSYVRVVYLVSHCFFPISRDFHCSLLSNSYWSNSLNGNKGTFHELMYLLFYCLFLLMVMFFTSMNPTFFTLLAFSVHDARVLFGFY